MATIKKEEGFKLGQPRPSTMNNRVYDYDVIVKLLQNQADLNEGETPKQPQKQHWRLNPKKERRVKKK